MNTSTREDTRTPVTEAQDYMDDHSLAVGDTMVRFLANADHTIVPSQAGPLKLTVLGSGAVVLENVRHLSVSEGYLVIRPRAISIPASLPILELPHTLREIAPVFISGSTPGEILCHLCLREEEVSMLMEASLPCGGKRILVRSQLSRENFQVPCTAFNAMPKPLPFLQEQMVMLLEGPPAVPVFDSRDCYDLSGQETRSDEYAAAMRMIRENLPGWRHPEAERQSDLRIRAGMAQTQPQEKLSLAEFDPKKVMSQPDGLFRLDLRIVARQLTAPALLSVRQNGKQYYLYSRQHLNSSPDCPYWREDMGIFDENGLITDRRLSEAVYVKARLPMLL